MERIHIEFHKSKPFKSSSAKHLKEKRLSQKFATQRVSFDQSPPMNNNFMAETLGPTLPASTKPILARNNARNGQFSIRPKRFDSQHFSAPSDPAISNC